MFDPIHVGHLDVGIAAERHLALSTVLIVPSNNPPHRPPPVASSYHRFAMCALGIADRPTWRCIDMELARGGQTFTADTLRRLQDEGLTADQLVFITGADAFAEIGTWKDYPAVLDLANFAVVSRPGLPVSKLPERLPSLAERLIDVKTDHNPDTPLIFLIDALTRDVSS